MNCTTFLQFKMKITFLTVLVLIVLISIVCASEFNLKNAALEAYNKLRDRHNVHPVKWNATLARHAQHWANQCYWGHSDVSIISSKYHYKR